MAFVPSPAFLNEKVILVTGAGNGIGAAVAKQFVRHGAHVVLLDKAIPALEKTYDAILDLATNSDSSIYPLDLKGASVDDYAMLASSIDENYGRLDGIVHCAATLGQVAPVAHQDTKSWMESLHVNLTAPYLLTKACLPLLERATTASIVFTTDANHNKAYQAAYGIAKAGIETLSKQLASELENAGKIRVNCIDPGSVRTDLFIRAFPGIDPGHLPEADDVTSPYLLLMSDDSLGMTGQILQT
jgi:NAD(P)-dependent dehydrogenase (short-subunit alcohol dehydrogenase family)